MQRGVSIYARKLLLVPALLILPVVFVVAVGIFAYHELSRVDALTIPDDYAKRGMYSAGAKLDDCLKAKTDEAGKIALSDEKECREKVSASTATDEQLKTRVDELKWMLTMIGSIGVFFVIAQGGAAFFSALAYTKQAEKALKDISDMEEEIRKRYPDFQYIEERRSVARVDLLQDLKTSARADDPAADPTEVLDYDYKKVLYGSMDVRTRQTILSLESVVPIDVSPGPLGGDSYPENLRRFAIFYQSKFEYEKSAGYGSLTDLERAESYLRLAVEKSRGDFTILNDLGVLCLSMHSILKGSASAAGPPPFDYAESAGKAFQRSLLAEPKQQRVHYNRAVLKAVHADPKDFAQACLELEQALKQENWQRNLAPDAVKSFIYYNLGCYRAQLLARDATKTVLTPVDGKNCIEALEEAAKLGGIKEAFIEGDYTKPTGDIYGAYQKSDGALKATFDRVKVDLIKSSAQMKTAQRPVSLYAVIQEGWKNYWASRTKP